MTVPTSPVSRPIATTPLVTHPVAPTDVSHPHLASRSERANGSFVSSSTPPVSHPTATSSRFYDTSHEPRPCVAPHSVPPCASSAPPPTISTSRSNVDISSVALSSPPQVASHASHPCIPPCAVRTSVSLAPSSIPPISHSTTHISSTTPLVARPIAPTDVSHPRVAARFEQANSSPPSLSTPLPSCSTAHSTSPVSSPPRRKRSRRCFVCGRTGKHRLNPRFCPRTYELLSNHLAKFDANFRLVSDDGSPLPMTRHPGGVAAHSMSPRRLPPRTVRIAPRNISKSPGSSQLNPPHVHRTPHAMPAPVPLRFPSAVPGSNLNPPHAPPAVVEHPRRISIPDHRFESNPPHLAHEEHSSSPLFRILTPICESLPRPETPSKSTQYPDNAFILLLLDCLTLSPSWRRELAGLIDAINHLNLDDDISALQKLMEPVRERYKTPVPFV